MPAMQPTDGSGRALLSKKEWLQTLILTPGAHAG